MKRLLFALLFSIPLLANPRAQGDCMQGGQRVVTSGLNSSLFYMKSYVNATSGVPSSGCTVTVYLHNTVTLAVLTDNSPGTTANPFVASLTGHWYFETAVDGAYDVTLSGGGIASPFTFGNIQVGVLNPFLLARNGVFNNTSSSKVIACNSAADASLVDQDADRLALTNVPGTRPAALECDMHVPANNLAYEANGVAAIILNASPISNAVSGSFFGAPNAASPTGTVNTSGTAVTLTGGTNFSTTWGASINKLIVINGVDYTISSVADTTHLTLTTSAGVQTGVTYIKRIYVWGINTLLSDGLPGSSLIYPGAGLLNEWDFNIFSTSSRLIAHSIGGNGSAQPMSALGYLVNTLGTNLKWDCGFCTLDGTASVGVQLGTFGYGNNTGSQPIQFFSRDSGGVAMATVMANDASGNLVFRVKFTGGAGTDNPQYVFQDGGGIQRLGIQGGENGATPAIAAGVNTRFINATVHFAALGAETGGSTIYCDDCRQTYPCLGSGGGAYVVRVNGAWDCGGPKVFRAQNGSYNPGTISAGATAIQTTTVTGCALGDIAQAGFSTISGTNFRITAIAQANQVVSQITNLSGGALAPGAGVLSLKCEKIP